VPLTRSTQAAAPASCRAVRFGENDFEEALDVLCHSAAHDASLSMTGRLALRDQVPVRWSRACAGTTCTNPAEIFGAPLVRR